MLANKFMSESFILIFMFNYFLFKIT